MGYFVSQFLTLVLCNSSEIFASVRISEVFLLQQKNNNVKQKVKASSFRTILHFLLLCLGFLASCSANNSENIKNKTCSGKCENNALNFRSQPIYLCFIKNENVYLSKQSKYSAQPLLA